MTDKDRHTAHISEHEKERAEVMLNEAQEFIDGANLWDAVQSIKRAMKILGMKENTDV